VNVTTAVGDTPRTRSPLQVRASLVHLGLVAFGVAIIAKSVRLQLVEHAHWAATATKQQVEEFDIAPPRGSMLDATGTPLVETREEVRLAIAPRELDPDAVKDKRQRARRVAARAALRDGLRANGVPDSLVRHALDRSRRWVQLPQRFLPADVRTLVALPGVHATSTLRRAASTSTGLRSVIGALGPEGTPVSGLEVELDPWLRGTSGRDARLRDSRGGGITSPSLTTVAARPGHTVTLTINQALQEIAEQQLIAALARTGASGGDVVIVDPRDGAVLAVAGLRNGKAPGAASPPLAEAYEPGSVMKPFVIARLLDMRRAHPDEVINTENGIWKVPGRSFTDEHKAASMTVRDVIRFSSNIGTVKLASRLNKAEEYAALRDFGFGAPSGIPYPAESRGRVWLPHQWDKSTAASMAIGYGITATPLQLAMAYTALANGGELLQPALVREVRDARDSVRFRHARTVVRRALSPATAVLMREMLESVVDSGTARAADLQTFDVAGKSGTARRAEGKSYGGRRYNSTFAGMFPARDPQFVIVARLIDSQQGYFGGIVAGGMVKEILQAALATRDAALDRGALAQVARVVPRTTAPGAAAPLPVDTTTAVNDAALAREDSLESLAFTAAGATTPVRVVIDLPFTPTDGDQPPARAGARGAAGGAMRGATRSVPSVLGLDVRRAARLLHAAGFAVALPRDLSAGAVVRTSPAAGASLRAGSTVQLEVRP